MIRRSLLALAMGACLAPSLTILAQSPITDTIFEAERRLGPVTQDTTLDQLKKLFGAKAVEEIEFPSPDGEESFKGARVMEGTELEFEVRFDSSKKPMKAEFVWIKGSQWKSADGLSTKTTVAELQKRNGKPFIIIGFGWEFSGFCNFEGGKMPDNFSIYVEPQAEKVPSEFYGDVEIRSNNKRLIALKPKISRIAMSLTR